VETRELARFLRNVVDQHGQSLRRLERPTNFAKTSISERLSGAERPEWEFVEALIKACTGNDQAAADQLLQQARRKWEAAHPSRVRPLEDGAPDPSGADAPGANDTLLPAIMERFDALDALLGARRADANADGGDPGGENGEHPAESAPVSPLLWGTPPRRAACFTGRDEVVAGIGRGFATHAVQVVHGPLGVGKTQIAVEYTHAFRSAYDLIAWIPAEEPASVRSSLAALAPRLGLAPAGTGEIGETLQAVLGLLSEGGHGERRLLVFDNADRPDRIQHLIPLRGDGDVLITSRDPAWRSIPIGPGHSGPGHSVPGHSVPGHSVPGHIGLGTFTREESLLFLAKRLSREPGRGEAHRLAAALGDLPLALQQAASLLNDSTLEIPEYLRGLADDANRALYTGDPSPYPIPMTAACALSAGLLSERSFDALSLLRHCAFLEAGPIPIAGLRAAAGTGGSPIDELLADPLRLAGALTELSRIGPLIRDEAGDPDERAAQGA
jgi:hypothetical protein